VDYGQFRLFKEIVQARSISRGAGANGVTQSAASQAVQELERVFGTQLLDRSCRPLEVTPSGRLFYDFCKDALRRKEEFEIELERLKGGAGGIVRVAAIYSVGLTEMNRLEAEFARRMPDARLEVDYLRPEKVYQAVVDDRVELGLISYPEPTREVVVVPWREERMVVATGPTHPLAARDVIRPQDLENVEFIGFDQDLPISRHIERFLREQGVHVQMVMHFDNIQSMKEALTLGNAVSILPEPILEKEVADGRLCAIPLLASLRRPLGIVHRRRKSFSPAVQTFLEVLQMASAS
jgi:DNA-binding transcriptional LysR family regulator